MSSRAEVKGVSSTGERFVRLHWAARECWEFVRPYGRWLYYWIHPERRPEYFRSAWRYPFHTIRDGGFQEANGGLTAKSTFVFFPMADWHTRTQRSQQLARALADMGRLCIYVNPHLGLEFVEPPLFSDEARLSKLSPRIYELHVHLPAEHPIHSRMLTRQESARVAKAVNTVLGGLGVKRAIQIVSLPCWLHCSESLRSKHGFPIIYDCHDYLPGFERLPPDILAEEGTMFRACDRVIFSAEHLMNTVLSTKPDLAAKASIVRNANSPNDFSEP